MKKVLQLSTYPIKNPLHGGQIRVSQIRKYFEQNNCVVRSLSLSELSHGAYTEDDMLVNDYDLNSLVSVYFCTDYATSLISVQGKYFEFLKKNILAFAPDVIMVEQVWLWPAIKRMLDEGHLKSDVKIVYSSQNIEYKTKKSLLESHDIRGKNVDEVIDGIRQLEFDMCEASDVVVCCTQIDADEFISMGAKSTIVCNNGVAKRVVNPEELKHIDDVLCGRKYALFVGSAYPPNAIGFWEMMGESLAYLPPDSVVLAAGGVSKILENYMPENAKLYSYVSMDRIKKLGFVSEELLAALVEKASVILLPITVGGGSNLKTAEAIASCRPVVATTTACRGFDMIENLSDFIVTNNQDEYVKSVCEFMKNVDMNIVNDDEKLARESVYWENTLIDLQVLLK